jgi:hypothetical protein
MLVTIYGVFVANFLAANIVRFRAFSWLIDSAGIPESALIRFMLFADEGGWRARPELCRSIFVDVSFQRLRAVCPVGRPLSGSA